MALDVDLLDPIEEGHPLNQGLVRWWLATQGLAGGPSWADLVGVANGTLASPQAWRPTARPGGSAEVACTGSAVAATLATPALQALTVACSVRFDSLPGGYHGVWRHDAWGSNGIYQVGNTVGAYNDTLISPQAVEAGRWYRLTVAVEGVSGDIRWYLDGDLVGTADGTANGYSSLAAGNGRFGGDAYAQYIAGALDDVAVWNRAFGDDEAAAEHESSRAGHPGRLRPASGGAHLAGGVPLSRYWYEIGGMA